MHPFILRFYQCPVCFTIFLNPQLTQSLWNVGVLCMLTLCPDGGVILNWSQKTCLHFLWRVFQEFENHASLVQPNSESSLLPLRWWQKAPLTDQSVGESEQENLPIHSLGHSLGCFLRVLQMSILIDKQKHYSRGGIKCGYPPNQHLFLCTCEEPFFRNKEHVNTKKRKTVEEAVILGLHKISLYVCVLARSLLRDEVRVQVSWFSLFLLCRSNMLITHTFPFLIIQVKRASC